jgi:hypothetical protein
MSPSRVLKDERTTYCEGKYCAIVKITKVSISNKFPDGIKVKCVLIDTDYNRPLLLLDNHEPYGYHFHPLLPDDKKFRLTISINSYEEALEIFFREVKKVVNK